MDAIDLIQNPYGMATFRNGVAAKLHFEPHWHDEILNRDDTASYRVESGWWIDYDRAGKAIDPTGQTSPDWDIVSWKPIEPPPSVSATLAHHACAGFGMPD